MPDSDGALTYGEPFALAERVYVQQGTFVISRSLDASIDEYVGAQTDAENRIEKFELPKSEVRDEAMRALYQMNMTAATLFPGIDGLARSMSAELEYKWW